MPKHICFLLYLVIMNRIYLQDQNQNFWALTCIQSAAQSVPGMLIGYNLSQEFGAGTALLSISIGNLILWIIGLSIVSMNYGQRTHAIENVRGYLGRPSAIIAAIILALAFMTWYVLEIKSTITSLDLFFQSYKTWDDNISIRVGAALGLLTALLAIGGIRLIRWISVVAFPFLLFFLIYIIATSKNSPALTGTWGISFSAIISTIVLTLPGFVNLPTFFRHSRSRADSYLALTLITIFDILFSISSIFIGVIQNSELNFHFAIFSGSYIYFFMVIFFIVISSICLNLVNIYFVSAGGESVLYRNWSSKEYTIIGLLGTAAYTFLQVIFPMEFIENLTNSFISTLGIVLLLAFLTRMIVRHRPRPLEKIISSTCWYCGCMISLISLVMNPKNPNHALILGVSTSLLIFITIIFFEEMIWSAQYLLRESGDNEKS